MNSISSEAVQTLKTPTTIPTETSPLQPQQLQIPQQQVPSQVPIQTPSSTLREDMIGNAVAFLTHPKVINSPEDRKRKFLKQKGLTDEEINEAILRSTGTNRSLTSFPVSTTSSSYPNSSSAQLPSNNNSLDYGRVPQNPTYTRTQLSSMSSFPPPLPINAVSQPSALPPYQLITPWKTIILLVLVLVGVGSTIAKWLRKLIVWYFGRHKESTKEKLDKLTRQMEEITQKMKAQEADLNEAMTTIRTAIETATDNEITRKRVEELRKRQENVKISELRKEINVIKAMLPALQFDNYTLQSEFLDQYSDLKNEIVSLKQMLFEKHKINKEKRKKETMNIIPNTNVTTANNETQTNSTLNDNNNNNSRHMSMNGTTNTTIPWLNKNKKPLTQSMPSWLVSSAENTTIPDWQLERDKKQQEDSRHQTNQPNGLNKENSHTNNAENRELNPTVKIPVTSPSESNNKNQSTNDNKNTLPVENNHTESIPIHVSHFASKDTTPPYSQNVLQVIEMLQQGHIPPNIRHDINDKPEDPEKPFNPKGNLEAKPKPWEKNRKQIEGNDDQQSMNSLNSKEQEQKKSTENWQQSAHSEKNDNVLNTFEINPSSNNNKN